MPPSPVKKVLFDLPSPAIFPHKAPRKSRKDKESPSFYTVVLSPDGVPEESIHYCKWAQLKVGDRNICKAGVRLKRSEKLEEAAGYWAAQRPNELPIFIYYEPHSNKGYSFDASSGVKTPWVFVESTVAPSHEDFLVMMRNNAHSLARSRN